MFPYAFNNVTIRDTDRVVPYTLTLHVHADYFIPHRHSYIEFSYVLEGKGHETINGKTHPLVPGTFSLLLPSQVHTIASEASDPVTFYVGAFSLELILGASGPGGGLERLLLGAPEELTSHVLFTGEKKNLLDRVFGEMFAFHEQSDIWSRHLFLARLTEAMILFDRERRFPETRPQILVTPSHSCSREDTHAPPVVHQQDMKILRIFRIDNISHFQDTFWHLVHHVQTHSDEPLTLEALSGLFHLSVPAISNGFRRLMGENYLHFLHGLRIQNACALLRSSPQLSVVQVAMDVGYSSYETFARVFRRCKGMSANQYRHLHKIKPERLPSSDIL